MEAKLVEIAMRIRELREILEITPEQAAQATNTSIEEYLSCENGQKDFSFTFLYQCAKLFGVDMVELVTGENPRLSFYSIVRKDEGLPIKRRAGFNYQHLAYLFKNKTCEPFLVTAPYSESEQDQPIHLSYHKGQEFDYILEGDLKAVSYTHLDVYKRQPSAPTAPSSAQLAAPYLHAASGKPPFYCQTSKAGCTSRRKPAVPGSPLPAPCLLYTSRCV